MQPITWSDCVGLPCAARKEQATSESRTPSGEFIPPFGVLRRVAFPLFAVLLGCVKRHKNLCDPAINSLHPADKILQY